MKPCPNCTCVICVTELLPTITGTKQIKSTDTSKPFCSHCTCGLCSDLTLLFNNLSISQQNNISENKNLVQSDNSTSTQTISSPPRKTLLERNIGIDNTRKIHKLIESSEKFVYVPSPKGTGKTDVMGTIKQIYEGEADVFKGTSIAKDGYDFKVHEVISVDFKDMCSLTPDEIDATYEGILKKCYFDNSKEYCPEEIKRFNERIVLIDSFDYLILSNIGKPDFYIIKEGLHNFCRRLEEIKGGVNKVIIFGNTQCIVKEFLSHFNDLLIESDTYKIFWFSGSDHDRNMCENHFDEVMNNYGNSK